MLCIFVYLTYRCHTRHREVQCRYVHCRSGRTVGQLRVLGTVVVPKIAIRRLRDIGQLPQPADLEAIVGVAATDRVPDAGQPMRDQHVKTQQ